MKVAVASTFVPFIQGGATKIMTDLVDALQLRGHEVETLGLPFDSQPGVQLEQMLALRLLTVSDYAERLIAIRTPSYLLRHPNKVVWFIHHHRGAYDLWGTPYQDIPATPAGSALRRAIHAADDLGLGEARGIFANSKVTAERLKRFNGIEAPVLYPPLPDGAEIPTAPAEDFVLYVSRVTKHKRQWLAAQAMAHVRSGVRLVIAGAFDWDEERVHLERTLEEAGARDRVDVIGRWISDEEKADLVSRCLGVLYLPFDEDSYGYPTLEAYGAAKPVVTCSDSGGTLEIVQDGVTGLVCAPDPGELAGAIDRLAARRDDAEEMGAAGRARVHELGISWDAVTDALLA
jgi:glycosyltransferase involved in cell wall biosynthesis